MQEAKAYGGANHTRHTDNQIYCLIEDVNEEADRPLV
jgi:hypothetical protein